MKKKEKEDSEKFKSDVKKSAYITRKKELLESIPKEEKELETMKKEERKLAKFKVNSAKLMKRKIEIKKVEIQDIKDSVDYLEKLIRGDEE